MYRLAFALSLLVTPALAEDEDPATFGTTNPDEMTWMRFRERAEGGETGMVLCSMGYMMTKSGDHDTARLLFENCAKDGCTGAMTWMSQLDNNGLGGDYDPPLRPILPPCDPGPSRARIGEQGRGRKPE